MDEARNELVFENDEFDRSFNGLLSNCVSIYKTRRDGNLHCNKQLLTSAHRNIRICSSFFARASVNFNLHPSMSAWPSFIADSLASRSLDGSSQVY